MTFTQNFRLLPIIVGTAAELVILTVNAIARIVFTALLLVAIVAAIVPAVVGIIGLAIGASCIALCRRIMPKGETGA